MSKEETEPTEPQKKWFEIRQKAKDHFNEVFGEEGKEALQNMRKT